MRELTVAEIEVVSGAGWNDWFGSGITEQIMKLIDLINTAFPGVEAPKPTKEQIAIANEICKNGISGMSTSTTGGAVSVSFGAVNGASMTITRASGAFAFQCLPMGNAHP